VAGQGKGIPGYLPFFRLLKQLIFQFGGGLSLINIPRIRLEAEMNSSFPSERQLAHFKLRELAPARILAQELKELTGEEY
jgi:hypothetical protein